MITLSVLAAGGMRGRNPWAVVKTRDGVAKQNDRFVPLRLLDPVKVE